MTPSIPDTAASVAGKVTGAGSVVTAVSAVASFDPGFWFGVCIGLAGLGLAWFFRLRDDKRKAEIHELMKRHIQNTCQQPITCPTCNGTGDQ